MGRASLKADSNNKVGIAETTVVEISKEGGGERGSRAGFGVSAFFGVSGRVRNTGRSEAAGEGEAEPSRDGHVRCDCEEESMGGSDAAVYRPPTRAEKRPLERVVESSPLSGAPLAASSASVRETTKNE